MSDTKQQRLSPNASDVSLDISINYADYSAPDFSLLGLSDEWKFCYDWCVFNGVADFFILIRAGVLFEEHPIGSLAYIFRFIQSADLRSVLKEWSFQDDTARDLHRLAQAIQTDPSILDRFSSTADERGVLQIHGNYQVRYLLGMLISRPKEADEEQQRKLAILKCWILILALQETKQGWIQDKRLRSVATGLRQSEDPDHFSRQAFLSVFPDLMDLDLIGPDLHRKADGRLAVLRKEGQLTEAERRLLSNLQKVAMGDLARETYNNKGTEPAAYQALLGIFDTGAGESEMFTTSEPDGGEDALFDILGIETDEDLREVETRPEASYAEQRSELARVLLIEAGKHQFLPYAWESLTPQEIQFLDQWIENTLVSDQPSERLLAVLVWIAAYTGQSLHFAMLTTLSNTPGKNWTLALRAEYLFRIPPYRHCGWLPNGAALPWVLTPKDYIQISLPENLSKVLKGLLPKEHEPGALWQLAAQAIGLSIDVKPKAVTRKYITLFRSMTATGPLSRIQPGMLGRVFPQILFNESEDAAYAHLLSSRDDRGMPGNCAYPSWYLPDEHDTIQNLSVDKQASNLIHIGLGSRLDPIEQRLINEIEAAGKRLHNIRADGDLRRFHNAMTGYVTVAILAATGARPIKDLVESPHQIDYERRFLFLDDKASDERSDGRLVPLPKEICEFLGTVYPKYLALLADQLENRKASELADAIRTLAAGQDENKLPFLFLLSVSNNQLSWQSVSETSLEDLGLFQWPLPWNLFRHRLAKQLRYRAIHPEIIDGLFGHTEATTATWGSYSLRNWASDMDDAAPALQAAYDNLSFLLPELSGNLPSLKRNWTKACVPDNEFGSNARQSARKAHREEVRRATTLEIEDYVKVDAEKTDLTALDEHQIETLSRKMMLLPNGPPRKNGWFRYSVLIDLLEAAWRDQGKKVRIKRRYARPFMEKSGFTPQAPNAHRLLKQLQAFVLKPSLVKLLNRKSLYQNCVLGALRLLAENRIADPDLLQDVLFRRNYRLVQYKDSVYLEYAPALRPEDPQAAVQRYHISPATAQVLNHALKNKRRWKKDDSLPPWLKPLRETIDAEMSAAKTVVGFIKWLTPVVQQANIQQFPGVVAACLNGYIHSIALNWADWVRMDTGHALHFEKPVWPEGKRQALAQKEQGKLLQQKNPPEDGDAQDLAFPDDIQPIFSSTAWQSQEPEKLQSSARAFRQMLASTLTEQEKVSSAGTYEARDRVVRELTRKIQAQAEQVSSSILLLGRWITRMLFRQVREGGRWHYITFSALQRYLTEFGDLFCDLAYNIDLAMADQDTVTALYTRFIDQKSEDGQSYALYRLMDFHDFVREEDVIDPDWSELPRAIRRFSVSPGIILENEYQDTLQILLNQQGLSSDFRYAQAFILLCGYRFGTRANEALGLRRKDWLEHFHPVELLIEPNRARPLKTTGSRRRVPLLFELSDLERDILDHVLLDDQLRYAHESSAYLFDEQLRVQEWRVMAGINQALKKITGNPATVLHHARHTAANRVTMALFQPALPQEWASLQMEELQRERTRKQLLITGFHSRRTSWAGSFYLGHAGPKTTLHSYVHFVGDWTDQLLDLPRGLPDADLDYTVVLDAFPRKAPVDTKLLSQLTPPLDPITPTKVLKLLRQISLGKDCRYATTALGINSEVCRSLEKVLDSLFKKIRVKETPSAEGEDQKTTKKARRTRSRKKKIPRRKKAPVNFLRRISIGGWQRLIQLGEQAELTRQLPQSYIKPNALREMIGATRQILLWKKSHFAAFQVFVDYFALSELPYFIVHSPGISEKRLRLAKKYGLEAVSARSASIKDAHKRGIELDRIQKGGSEDYQVRKRFAAILTRNQVGNIHGSYEWILLFIALTVASAQHSPR